MIAACIAPLRPRPAYYFSCLMITCHSSRARAPWKNNASRTTSQYAPAPAAAATAAGSSRLNGCSEGGSVVPRSRDHPTRCSLAEGQCQQQQQQQHEPARGDYSAASPGPMEALALLWSGSSDGSLTEQGQQDGEGGEGT